MVKENDYDLAIILWKNSRTAEDFMKLDEEEKKRWFHKSEEEEIKILMRCIVFFFFIVLSLVFERIMNSCGYWTPLNNLKNFL